MPRRRNCVFLLVVAWLVLCCLPLPGSAQQPKSTAPIVVVVTEPTGRIVPHAEIKIVPSLTPSVPPQRFETNESGRLSVDLVPGEYDITVNVPLFKAATRHILAPNATGQTVGIVLAKSCLAYCDEVLSGPIVPSGPTAGLHRVELAPIQDLPEACSQGDIAKYGRPILFPRSNGVAFGVSISRDHYKKNEEARVYIWLSNESAAETGVIGSCCERTFLNEIQVVDIYGRRLESMPEFLDRKILQQGYTTVEVCSCSGPLTTYPPGFCGVVDSGTINRHDTAYGLTPGTYIVEQKTAVSGVDRSSAPVGVEVGEEVTGLAITIEE
jgi:hypothetical protein